MKNKNGFTLIELLAVIVILAVIAIIAIPIITNVIDNAKKGALKDSAYGILDSAEMYLAKNINKGIDDTMEFTCNNGKCLSGTEEIDYKGKIESGKVRIYTDSKIELCVSDNKSSALKTVTGKKVEVVSGTCDYGELNYGVTALVSKEALDEMTEKYNNLKALADQTNITADDIKEGKKALVNGEVITGTNKGTKKILLGTATSYDLKTNYETYGLGPDDYKNITNDNFIVVSNSGSSGTSGTLDSSSWGHIKWNYSGSYSTTSSSYNATTGAVSINCGTISSTCNAFNNDGGGSIGGPSARLSCRTYLIY